VHRQPCQKFTVPGPVHFRKRHVRHRRCTEPFPRSRRRRSRRTAPRVVNGETEFRPKQCPGNCCPEPPDQGSYGPSDFIIWTMSGIKTASIVAGLGFRGKDCRPPALRNGAAGCLDDVVRHWNRLREALRGQAQSRNAAMATNRFS
jgi:hypothetical protein